MNKEIVYLEQDDPHTTLTTWIYKAFWMAHKAIELGKTPYINWHQNGGCLRDLIDKRKFAEMPNMYNWYFKQPFTDIPGERKEAWVWEKVKWGADITDDNRLMNKPVNEMRDFFQKYLIFNDVVDTRGQALVDKYGIDFSKTIGITVRGTDNVTDGRFRIPIERYYKWIDKALMEIPDAKIVCTAEEAGHLAPLLVRYPQAIVIDEFRSSPPGSLHNPERNVLNDGRSGFERGMQPALMVWLFSKCAWYIKNRSSTGAVASWLSDGNIVCLGHAETLNYDKLDNMDEFKGERIPI